MWISELLNSLKTMYCCCVRIAKQNLAKQKKNLNRYGSETKTKTIIINLKY